MISINLYYKHAQLIRMQDFRKLRLTAWEQHNFLLQEYLATLSYKEVETFKLCKNLCSTLCQ